MRVQETGDGGIAVCPVTYHDCDARLLKGILKATNYKILEAAKVPIIPTPVRLAQAAAVLALTAGLAGLVAGIGTFGNKLHKIPEQIWQDMIDVNLSGHFRIIQAVIGSASWA